VAIAELAASGELAKIAETWKLPASAVKDLPESGLE
jgi:ABC-type amino acid transport substrate-binding protein